MAAPLTLAPRTRRARRGLALLVTAAWCTVAVGADTLTDPTRSPLAARGDDTGGAVAPKEAPAPLRLQMIVRGPGERRTAVIDGTKVGVGDTVALHGGRARVERITDTSVVLARADGKETLQLLPGAERAVRCIQREHSRNDSQRPGGC